MSGTLAVGLSLDTPVNPLSSESPLFSEAQTYFRKGVHISVKMHRIDMTLCQRDVKQFSASIGHNSMYRKLSLRTCDARWRSQPRPPSQHKPVSAQLLWLDMNMNASSLWSLLCGNCGPNENSCHRRCNLVVNVLHKMFGRTHERYSYHIHNLLSIAVIIVSH